MNATAAPAARDIRARRWLRRTGWVLASLTAIALVATLAFHNLGRWLEAPAQAPTTADVIVLLGGDHDARLTTGLDLYRRRMAPKIFLAGAESEAPAAHPPVPDVRLDYLLAHGVPREAIVVDGTSRSSEDEASATLGMLRRAGWRTAIVVSDPPHLRRLSWIWQRRFAGSDASYVLVSSRPRWWRSEDWWRDEWARQFVRSEVVKLGYYAAFR